MNWPDNRDSRPEIILHSVNEHRHQLNAYPMETATFVARGMILKMLTQTAYQSK